MKAKKLKYVSRGGLKLEKPEPIRFICRGKITIDIELLQVALLDVMLQTDSQVFSGGCRDQSVGLKLRNDPR